MSSFYDVVSGNTTMAVDINQYADRLNGSVGAQITVLAPTNALTPITAQLPSAPTSDLGLLHGQVSGDAFARISGYIRGADGYGGFKAGAGVGAQTAHLYAQANGWRTDESLSIGGALNVTGTTTLAGLNANSLSVSGTSTLGGVSTGNLNSNGSVTVSGILDVVGQTFLDNGNISTNGAGVFTCLNYQGAIAIDVESSQTVMRVGAGAVNLVIQVGGHNWTFFPNGQLTTPTGVVIK